MIKWLTITLIAVVAFITILLALGYLLKEHEIATTQLKQQLDQERHQQKSQAERKQKKLSFNRDVSSTVVVTKSKKAKLLKQKILVENLTCTSKKQCVLVNITFADLTCSFAVNTIGASLLAKVDDETGRANNCPNYPENSQLSCQSNLCSYGSVDN
jgi:uncharacterized oligopeptide transporter (OPT) family protein